MKIIVCALIGLMEVGTGALGQTVIERGPHHNVLQWVESEQIGEVTQFVTNEVTQLGSGLNYWDSGKNAWVPSSDEIDLLQSGAVYQRGQFKLIFASNINDPNGNLEWFPSPDTRIVLQTVGLAMTEVATGNSVFIAQIKDTQGFLTAPNEVTYPACFDQIDADVRISVNPLGSGFQNDVILHQRVPDPATFGFQGEVRIEAWHQIISGPNPELQPGAIQRAPGVVEPDTQLRFTSMMIGPGTAFLIGTNRTELAGAAGKAVRVAKAYFVDPETQMRFLVEAVPFADVAPQLQRLPPSEGAFKLSPSQKQRFEASGEKGGKRKPIALAEANRPIGKKVAAITRKEFPETAGLLLDYTSLVNQNNYTLRGDTTYLVATNTTVTLSGTTVLEPGCVIKFDGYNSANGTPVIIVNGPIDCQTRPYAPAVFTSREDRTVGETNTAANASISNIAYGGYHLKFPASNGNPIQLHDIRSRFAQNAFGFLGTGAVEAWNIQVYGAQGDVFEGAGNTITLRNVLVHNSKDVAVSTANNTVFSGEHFTIHQASKAFNASSYTGCSFSAVNSLLAVVTNTSSSGFTTTSSHTLVSDAGVFQTVGGGAHYLADNSPYRNTGSTSISTNLTKSVFRYSTTYPPLLLATTIGVNTTLAPQAQRDLDAPDEGYHYPAIDWTASNVTVSATLTLTNGAAIGYCGVTGFTLNNNSRLVSEGAPTSLNRLVRYNTVQEQPVDWGATGATMQLFKAAATVPQLNLRFTEVAHLAYSPGSGRATFLSLTGSAAPTDTTLADCEFYSSAWSVSDSSLGAVAGYTNNIFHRCSVTLYQLSGYNMVFRLYNNLFRYGSLSLLFDNTLWTAKDNLFDNCAPYVPGTVAVNNSNNGYINATPMTGAVNTYTITAPDYQTGVLGRWYYPITGVQLATLVDHGSRSAANAGLYHHTTRVDHSKEAGTTVDIGHHYVAIDANGAIDTDGDGIPDYLEDRNGNGIADTGESSWTSAINNSGGLNVYTPLQP
jgi:hypothetical protein